jgi:transcription antitermination factor NusG
VLVIGGLFMMRWHVGQVNSGLDLSVRRHLKREGFEDNGRAVFSPSYPLQKKLFGRGTGDVFPGYIFLRFDQEADFVWQKAKRIKGITRLLPGDGYPGFLPEGFVERMIKMTEAGEFTPKSAEALARSYVRGDFVEIDKGPFSGYAGEMVKYRRGGMVVLLALLGGKREVTIPPSCVAPPVLRPCLAA